MNQKLKRVVTLSMFFSLLAGIAALYSILPGALSTRVATGTTTANPIAASDATPSEFPGRITYLARAALVDNYGTFSTQDKITYRNTDPEPVSYFYICLNESQTTQLYEMTVSGISGERFYYTLLGTKLSGYNTWQITFPSPVMPDCEIDFVVTRYFDGAITSSVTNATMFATLYHTTFPIVPYHVDIVTCAVTFPQNTNITSYIPASGEQTNNVIRFSAVDSYPFSTYLLHVAFNHQSSTFCETEKSVITITAGMESWHVSNVVTITNKGTIDLTTLTFTVPSDAYEITAKDTLSFIQGVNNPNTDPDVKFKNVTINLLVNRYKVTTGMMFSFTLSFRLPLTTARAMRGDTKNAIFVDIFQIVNNPWHMKDVEARIALPQASSIDFSLLNSNPSAVDNKDGVQYLIYRNAGATRFSSKVITVMYEYSSLAMQIRPLEITLVAGLIAMFFIIARKAMLRYAQPVSTIAMDIPVDSLKDFTEIFEEKVAAYADLDTLNDDFQRRKIKKREYQIKVDDLTRRIKLLDNQVKPSKRKLLEFGGRFKEILEELDLLEAERQSVQDSLITLERRYKDGQIKSRVAYEQLYENYAVRLKKIQGAIDSGLNELKSYFT
ncbi:MAG: hypothetical protein GYA24_08610 [Candidatus Lokiarchaeota archaeon]|nr:hypothetical protein [Candidatus Lokiarchaeota archaeon]